MRLAEISRAVLDVRREQAELALDDAKCAEAAAASSLDGTLTVKKDDGTGEPANPMHASIDAPSPLIA